MVMTAFPSLAFLALLVAVPAAADPLSHTTPVAANGVRSKYCGDHFILWKWGIGWCW